MQVFMNIDGEMAVHGNVTFEVNTAGEDGGAVSLPFDILGAIRSF
jgi:predicted outer membrane repeat protein